MQIGLKSGIISGDGPPSLVSSLGDTSWQCRFHFCRRCCLSTQVQSERNLEAKKRRSSLGADSAGAKSVGSSHKRTRRAYQMRWSNRRRRLERRIQLEKRTSSLLELRRANHVASVTTPGIRYSSTRVPGYLELWLHLTCEPTVIILDFWKEGEDAKHFFTTCVIAVSQRDSDVADTWVSESVGIPH